MTIINSCENLTYWVVVNGTIYIDSSYFVEGTGSILWVVNPSIWGSYLNYIRPLGLELDLRSEPILKVHLRPDDITERHQIFFDLITFEGEDYWTSYQYGALPLASGQGNEVMIDLRTPISSTPPGSVTPDLSIVRGLSLFYEIKNDPISPTCNVDYIQSVSGIPDIHITGTVQDQDGIPLDGVNISTNGFSAISQLYGIYDLLVPPGTYSITYSKIGYAPLTVNVDASSDVAGLDIALNALPAQAILTIGIEPVGGGNTEPAPGSYSVNQGTSVSVTANPSEGYLFDYWELDGVNVGMNPSITVMVDLDHILIASFTPKPMHTLTITSTPVQGIPFTLERITT